MSFLKIKVFILLVISFISLVLGIYMATAGQTPPMGSNEPFLILNGIDRLMGLYPIGLGLYLGFKAKWDYEDNFYN